MVPQLRAGAARTDITPPVGIAHGNWGAQTHTRATGADLNLWATALVLASGDEKVAIVDADLCYFTPELGKATREAVSSLTGIPFTNVRISATHTHSGPTIDKESAWFTEGTELVRAYADSLPGRIAGVVWEASNKLKPARIAAGNGWSEINVNRRLQRADLYGGKVFLGRNWKGFVDREVKVARIDDENEQPIATLVNYACHPTIMAHLNTLITPDYPGVTKRVVEQVVGGYCLFLQGATGNLHAIRDYVGDVKVYHWLGTLLGLEAAKVALSLSPLPKKERFVHVLESGAELGIYADEPAGEPDSTLRIVSREVTMPLKPVSDIAEADAVVRQREAELEAIRKTGTREEISHASMLARRARMKQRMARTYAGQTETKWELQAIRVGGLGLVAVPGEPFAEIGYAVKKGSPLPHTMFSGYSHGGLGYVPMPEDYPAGGYGADTSPFAVGASQAMIDASLKALKELAD